MPALVTFAALFGGVEVFGPDGLLVGPVLMALAIATGMLESAGVLWRSVCCAARRTA